MLVYVQGYMLCGATEKGREVLESIAGNYEQRLRYFAGFPAKYRRGLQSEVQDAVNVLGSVKYFADLYGLDDLSRRMADLFAMYNIQA